MLTLLALATLQAWFVAGLVATRGERRLADRILVTWLALLGLHTGSYWLFMRAGWAPPLLLTLSSSFPFLQGPFLFVYVESLVSGRTRLSPSVALHLVPWAGFVAYQRWWLADGAPAGEHGVHLFDVSGLFTALLLLSVPAYAGAALVLIQRYRRGLSERVSTAEDVDLRWLRALVAGLAGVWAVVLATFLARALSRGVQSSSHLVFVALAIFVYALGFLAARGGAATRPPAPSTPEAPEGTAPKYRKSGLAPEEAEELHERLLRYMREQRPHLDSDLDLQGLAGRLGVSPNHLSQVLNERERRSFYDFVNAHRVEAVREALTDPAERERSLLDLALACGFRSKSTFNRIFKQHIGATPSLYRSGGGSGSGGDARPVS